MQPMERTSSTKETRTEGGVNDGVADDGGRGRSRHTADVGVDGRTGALQEMGTVIPFT